MGLVLDLLRHGLSVPAGPGGDRLRELSEQGTSDLAALGRHLAGESWRPDRILASPYRRTLASAMLVTRTADVTVPIEPLAALEPERDPEAILTVLAALRPTDGHVLLVGHQPLLGLLVGRLTGTGRSLAAGTMLRLECAGAADRGGRVVRVLAPGELERS
jgi:phosphohistidine phosphatase